MNDNDVAQLEFVWKLSVKITVIKHILVDEPATKRHFFWLNAIYLVILPHPSILTNQSMVDPVNRESSWQPGPSFLRSR